MTTTDPHDPTPAAGNTEPATVDHVIGLPPMRPSGHKIPHDPREWQRERYIEPHATLTNRSNIDGDNGPHRVPHQIWRVVWLTDLNGWTSALYNTYHGAGRRCRWVREQGLHPILTSGTVPAWNVHPADVHRVS